MKQLLKVLVGLVFLANFSSKLQAQYSPDGQVNFFAPSIISACNRDTFFLEFTNKNGPVVPAASDIVTWEITSPAPAIIKFENVIGTYTAGATVNFISNTAGVLKFSAKSPTLGSKIKIWFLTNTTCPVTTLNLPQLSIKTTYPTTFNPSTSETYPSSMMNPGVGQLTWTNPYPSGEIRGFKFQSNHSFPLRNSGLGRISAVKYYAIVHDSLLGYHGSSPSTTNPNDYMFITGANVPYNSVSKLGTAYPDYTIARYDALHRIISWTIKGADLDAVDGYLDPGDVITLYDNYLQFPNTCQPDMDKKVWFSYECPGSANPCVTNPDTMTRLFKITAGTPIINGVSYNIQQWDGCPNKTGSFSFKNTGIGDPTRPEVSTAFDVDLTLNFGGLLNISSFTIVPAGITTNLPALPANAQSVKLNIKNTLTSDPDGAGKGLEDLDGDGFFDDLKPGDSIKCDFVWSVPQAANGLLLNYNISTSAQFTDYCKKLNGAGSTSMYQFGFSQVTAVSQKTPVPQFGNLSGSQLVTKTFDFTFKFKQTNLNLATAVMKLRINYDKNKMIVEPIYFLGKTLTLADFTTQYGAGDIVPVTSTAAGYADSTNNVTDIDSAIEYTLTAADMTKLFDNNLDSLTFSMTHMSCRTFQNTPTAVNNWQLFFQSATTNCPSTGAPPTPVDLAGKKGVGYNVTESCTPGRPCFYRSDTLKRISAIGFTDENQTTQVVPTPAGTSKFYIGDTLELINTHILSGPHQNMEPIGTTPYGNNWYYGFRSDILFSWSKTPGDMLLETNSAFNFEPNGSMIMCIDTTTGMTLFSAPIDKSDFYNWSGYDGLNGNPQSNSFNPGQKALGDNLFDNYSTHGITYTNSVPGFGLGDYYCFHGSSTVIDPAYCPYGDIRAISLNSTLQYAMQNDDKTRISESYKVLVEKALVRAGITLTNPGQTKYKWVLKTRWSVNPEYKKHTNLNDFRVNTHGMERYGNYNDGNFGAMPATSYVHGCAVQDNYGSVLTKDIKVDGAGADYSAACGLTVRNALNFNNNSGDYIAGEVRVPYKMDSFVVDLPAEYHTTAAPTLTAASSCLTTGGGTSTSIVYSGGTASAGGVTGHVKFISTGMPYSDFPRFNDADGNTTPWVVTYPISNTGTDNFITQTYKVPVKYYLRDEWNRPYVKIDTFTITEATPAITVTPLGGPIIMNDGGACSPGYMDVLVANNTIYGASNVWIAAESTSTSTLVSVEDVGTYADPIEPADVTTYGANHRFIKIGGMAPAAQRVVRLKFNTTVCSDNVKIISNFGCNYPAGNVPAYPSPTIDSAIISYNAPAPTIMSAPINGNKRLTQLCDTAWLEVDLRNAGNPNMYGVKAGWKLPSTVRYVPGSAQIAYPTTTYAAATGVTVVGTDSLNINIMADADITACGIRGADEENSTTTTPKPNLVKFKIAVTFAVCPSQGIDPVIYTVKGQNYCGLTTTNNGVFNFIYTSSPSAPNVYDIAPATTSPIKVCNGSNAPLAIKDTILVKNVSGPASVNTDSMELIVAVDTARMNITTPITAVAPWTVARTYTNLQGRTVYVFAMQTIASGASMPLILNYTVQTKQADICATATPGTADLIKSASFYSNLKVECVAKGLTCPSLGKENKGGGFAGKNFTCCVLPNPKIDTNITPEETPVSGNVLTNDTYPAGSTVSIVNQPKNGTLVLNPTTGAYTYTPNPDFNGLDTAKYRICDTNTPTPNCKDTLIIIRVTPVNDPPVLTTTPKTTTQGTAINICNSFTDVDGTPAYVSYSCQATNGTTSAYSTPGNNSCATYTPNSTFYGTDSFCMIVCDAAGLCDTVMQYVTVTQICPSFVSGSVLQPSCTTSTKGSIKIIVTKYGTNNVEYSRNGGTSWQSSDSFGNLNAGSYTITVRDMVTSCVIPAGTYVIDSFSTKDTDLDGVVDLCDLDDDNDGISDSLECPSIPWRNISGNFCSAFGAPLDISTTGGWAAYGLVAGDVIIRSFDTFNTTGCSNLPVGGDSFNRKPRLLVTGNVPVQIRVYHGQALGVNTTDGMTSLDGVTYTFTSHTAAEIAAYNAVIQNGHPHYGIRKTAAGGTAPIGAFQWTSNGPATHASVWTTNINGNTGFELRPYKSCDFDNDGIPNALDKDSDNDGCPDYYESGAAAVSTAANDSTIAGPYGSNGLANSVENKDSLNASTTYTSTYNAKALNASDKSACCPVITNNSISAPQSFCAGLAPDTLRGTLPVLVPTQTISYKWLVSSVSSTSGYTLISGAVSKDYKPGVLADTMWYRRIVSSLDPACKADTSAPLMIGVNVDCDGDGVPYSKEITDGTNPNDPCDYTLPQTLPTSTSWNNLDCDGDGVINGTEVANGTNPKDKCSYVLANQTLTPNAAWNNADCDGDGVTNLTEVNNGTNPQDSCSYNSAMQTYANTSAAFKAADCDKDGVTNGKEIDPDGNGTPGPNGTNPNDPCSLTVANQTLASPAWDTLDCDGDGIKNAVEKANGTNPQDPCSFRIADVTAATIAAMTPAAKALDCDGDGLTNIKEIDPDGNGTPGPNGTDPANPCSFTLPQNTTPTATWNALDCDGDGVNNGKEMLDGTNPKDSCDYLAGSQVYANTSAAFKAADCDQDGVTNGKEIDPDGNGSAGPNGTNPKDPCSLTVANQTLASPAWDTLDCDGDGVKNAVEKANGSDPSDPCSFKMANVTTATIAAMTPAAKALDCDGDGVTNIKEIDPNGDGTLGPNATDPTDPCKYTAADRTVAVTAAWNALDCDGDGNPNGTDPNPLKPVAKDDSTVANVGVPKTISILGNDDFLPNDGNTITRVTGPGAGTATGTVVFDPITGNMTYTAPVSEAGKTVTVNYIVCQGTVCDTALVTIVVPPITLTNPDVNSTFVNVPVQGSVKTNDSFVAGTTYGAPTPLAGNPGSAVPTMNPNGTYSFTSPVPGVFYFNVPVCPPNVSTDCPMELLTITVLDPNKTDNDPVANTDITSTKQGVPVTLNTLANDKAGNDLNKLVPSSVTITDQPNNGTATVDPVTGNITYTPNSGFVGDDTLKYSVCDNANPANCTEAYQIITVLPTNSPNKTVAADDYVSGTSKAPMSGNALTNDSDPEGHTGSVTPQTTTVAGKGTLVLNADGSFVFTPVPGYNGPVSFPYEKCDNGTPIACTMATIYVMVNDPNNTDPDFNETFVNTPVTGNLKTNDEVKPGTTYGSPTPIAGNPSTDKPVINPDGTYSFTSDTPGVYQFNVPVCPPGQTTNCPMELLTITVLDPNKTDNAPVANTDNGTTKEGTPVKLATLSNDKSGDPLKVLVPSSVTVTDAPSHGTTTVDPVTGDITYTPNPGFTGMDTLKYSVCDNSMPAKCTEAIQVITVLPSTYPNTTEAADDYIAGTSKAPTTGNALTNDTDPEGNGVTVTPQTTTVAGKGTLVLNADGSFVFTPVAGYNGPVDFPYEKCDSGTPKACAMATIHVLVNDPTNTDPDVNTTFVNTPVTGNLKTNDDVKPGTTYGSPTPIAGNPSTDKPVINPDGTYTFTSDTPGVYQFNVPVCPPGQTTNCPMELLTITVLDPFKQNPPVANTDIATTKESTPVKLNTISNDQPGNTYSKLDPTSVTITDAPSNGTTTVDPVTGDITYTPNPGFTGIDTLKYQVCDSATPKMCSEAYQIITVLPSTYPNTTDAADDYVAGTNKAPISGNALKNDTDPEGHGASITPQTTTQAGKGTLVLNADGSFVFTPVVGYHGPVDFPYEKCDSGTPKACTMATIHVLVEDYRKTNPDVNTTWVDSPVTGNMKTNDVMPTGTTYSNPVAVAGNPSTDKPVVNPDGTYTFKSDTPGVYQFNVTVCPPGQSTNCPTELLTITVLNPKDPTNPPVANTDIATTKEGTPVKLNTLGNDQAGNIFTALDPSTVTVTDAPSNGTATVDPATGDITYTPNAGFTGIDTLKYKVCDDQNPAKCAEAFQIITVLPKSFPNLTTATDDYVSGPNNGPITGNAMLNDVDPEGDGHIITPQTTTAPGKGTLVLNSDGTFTFTPVPGFSGPVDFPYEVCDSGTPKACAMATIHVLVEEYSKTNPDINETWVNKPVSGNLNTNDVVPAGTTYGSPTPIAGNPNSNLPTINPDGTYTFVSDKPGVYQFNVPVCPPGQSINCPMELLTITVLDPDSKDNNPVANTDIASTKMNNPVTLSTLSNDKIGNDDTKLDPASVSITELPKHGTATVDPTTGNITYTPNAGFTGIDTLKYNVCDNSKPTPKCAQAYQIITVLPTNYPNTTNASDDYASGTNNGPIKGNALLNDTDPEDDGQIITPQTTTVAGKGTLVLNSDGTFTFTPEPGFVGPIDFPYEVCDSGTPKACTKATIHILVEEYKKTNPDVNQTWVNVPVTGNLTTNDVMPAGTTYGTPTPLPGNPSDCVPTVNPNGTYTFTCDSPGVYQFNVPVCPPGQTTNCPMELLTITVLDPSNPNNPPVANTDYATTKEDQFVKLNTLANDKPGSAGKNLVPSSVKITEQPKNGSATVDTLTGEITYTPLPGFTGKDTLKYTVCDDNVPSKCTEAYQIITILPKDFPNVTVADDDYATCYSNSKATGNAKLNDKDPEGNNTTITPQTTTIPGKGTLVLKANGDYEFTPEPGFVGPVEFPYESCDDGTPKACTKATIHILVKEYTKLNPDVNTTFVDTPVTGNMSTNDVMPAGTTYGTPVPDPSNPSSCVPTVSPNGSYTFTCSTPGVYKFLVPVCPPGQTANCPMQLLTITVLGVDDLKNIPSANTDIASTRKGKPVTLNTLANDLAGNPNYKLDPSSVTITEQPKNGTATVDPSTGKITYTPKPGFVGKDTLKYRVCDNAIPTPNCTWAYQIIDVLPDDYPNSTFASDDYNSGAQGTTLTGNVLDNDGDPEGDKQTVVPQTTTIPNVGTLVLNSDGKYTFTPELGFVGPVNFPYTVCDNGTPQACTQATLYILVSPANDIVLPNYFSPNGDGTNDKWVLPNALYAKYPNLKILIYNRWGNVVYRSNGKYNGEWAGEHLVDQQPLPDGVYYYVIELDDKFRNTKTGFVEIMRK